MPLRRRVRARSRRSSGRGRRFELRRRARRHPRRRRLRAPSGRARRDAGRRARPLPGARLVVAASSRTCRGARGSSPREFAEALPGADVVVLCETYVARGAARPRGAAAAVIVERAARAARPASRSCSRRPTTTRRRRCAGWSGPATSCCAAAPGRSTRVAAGGAGVTARPALVQRGLPARPADDDRHRRARRASSPGRRDAEDAARRTWPGPSPRGSPCAVVGLGSNLLPADEGFDGLVLRLEGDARRDRARRQPLVRCGGGASLAAIVRRTRDAGLVGHRVRLRHPRHRRRGGAHERRRVRPRDARRAGRGGGRVGGGRRGAGGPEELDLRYRGSNVRPDEVVAARRAAPDAGRPAGRVRAHRSARMQDRRTAAQPRKARTFGSRVQEPARRPHQRPAARGAAG